MKRIHWGTRIGIGAGAGMASVISKFYAQDASYFSWLMETGRTDTLVAKMLGYLVPFVSLMVLGAICAAVNSSETNRWKLFALAIAAPAWITTLSGGTHPDGDLMRLSFVNSVYAQEQRSNIAPGDGDGTAGTGDGGCACAQSFWDGMKLFFGFGKEIPYYRVVVASYPDLEAANAAALALSKTAPQLEARVAGRKEGNNFYAVVVGQYEPYRDAKMRLEQAKQLLPGTAPFLSPQRRSPP